MISSPERLEKLENQLWEESTAVLLVYYCLKETATQSDFLLHSTAEFLINETNNKTKSISEIVKWFETL